MTDLYIAYVTELVTLGHDQNWVRQNEPALRQRFARDPEPFRALPPPPAIVLDRYEDL